MSNSGSRSAASYSVLLLPRAERDLERIPDKDVHRISKRIDVLKNRPRSLQSIKLVGGTNHYRLRAGDYRVLYTISDSERRVVIYEILHRKDAYR